MNMWTAFANLHLWFEVLQTIEIPRLFERDELDAKYADHMARFMNLAARTGVNLYRNYLPLCYRHEFLLC